jgi:homoserine O-acetyltransferase
LEDCLRRLGKEVEYHELDSPHGHDAFLKEWEQMTQAIGPFVSARSSGADAQ